jgi:MFS family permease
VPQGELAEKPFDWAGFVLTGAACFALMLGIQLLSLTDPPVLWVAVLLIGGLVVGVGAVWQERRLPHPLVDLYALRFKSFSLTVVGGTLFRAAIGAVPFLLPLLFQIGFGLDAFVSGLLVLAVFAGNIVMKIFTTSTLNRFGFRRVLVVNGFLNAAVLLACALIDRTTPVPVILALLFVSGLTRSMQFTTLSTIAYAEVPQEQMNGANTVQNVIQPIGFALGIAVAALALRVAGLIFPSGSPALSMPQFHTAFVIVGLIALVGVFDTLGLAAGTGDDLRKMPARRGKRRVAAGSAAE